MISPKAILNITKAFLIRNRNRKKFISEVSGNLPSEIEQRFKKEFIPNEQMIKHMIPSQSKRDLKISLANFGINAASIYPDLENIAKTLREKYK